MHQRKGRGDSGQWLSQGEHVRGVSASGLREAGARSPTPSLRAQELELGQIVSEVEYPQTARQPGRKEVSQ